MESEEYYNEEALKHEEEVDCYKDQISTLKDRISTLEARIKDITSNKIKDIAEIGKASYLQAEADMENDSISRMKVDISRRQTIGTERAHEKYKAKELMRYKLLQDHDIKLERDKEDEEYLESQLKPIPRRGAIIQWMTK